jgi:hypothetical protein
LSASGIHNQEEMHPLVRRALRPIAAVMIAAIATLASVACLQAGGVTPQERACCAAMADDCSATMAADHGCCSTETGDQAFEQLTGFSGFSFQKPVLTLVATIAFLQQEAFAATAAPLRREPRGSPASGRGVPAYLALSTLRV